MLKKICKNVRGTGGGNSGGHADKKVRHTTVRDCDEANGRGKDAQGTVCRGT